MKFVKKVLARIAKPLSREVIAKEPALAAAATGAALELATHYGLHLTAGQQTWVTGIIIAGVGWVTRQSVSALSTLAEKK